MRVISVKGVLWPVVGAAVATTVLVAITSGSAEAAGVPCQRTYSTGMLNVPIPDGSIFSELDVPEDGLVVSDVDVTLNIDHTFVQDLNLSLVSYTDGHVYRGSAYVFAGWSGEDGDNLTGTILDDQAATPITWGVAPFTGRFKPTTPLSDLNGHAGGLYELVVRDQKSGGLGTLVEWSVTLRYQSCDFDSDGVEDHADKCLGVTAHTATGCPLTSRTLTAKYKLGKFRGALSSPVGACKAARAITIWKVRSGPDARVGTANTRSDGSYRLRRAKRIGRYYATSPRVAVTGVAECPAVTSAIFRIR